MKRIPLSATPFELGEVVKEALDGLSGGFVHVQLAEALAVFRAHLKEIGFKNVANFEKGACVTSIEFDGDCYTIVSNQKDRHDINVASGSQTIARESTTEELGRSILAGMESR